MPVGAVQVKKHPVAVIFPGFAVNAVGALGRVVVVTAADATDDPPAFVSCTVMLLYGVFAVRPVMVAVVPDRVDVRVLIPALVVALTVQDVIVALPV